MLAAFLTAASAFAQDDELDNAAKQGASSSQGMRLPDISADLLKADRDALTQRALSRVKLVESPELKLIREKEPEPGPGRLIYKDDFESYEEGSIPPFWSSGARVATVDTPANKGKVLKIEKGETFLSREIQAANFRLKYDFLCGTGGEVTWIVRVHGPREHGALWSNENYYQIKFGTAEGQPIRFSVNHLWTGGGYPFDRSVQPAVEIPQPSHKLAWHTAEIVMDDDRIILKFDGIRMLDGHYPILMARTKKDKDYTFGAILRDAYPGAPKDPWVYYDWYDNIEIYDLGTPVKERRWPARLHVAPWGSDENTGTDPAHPWGTLKKAFRELRKGDRLTLQAGTYNESVSWIDPLPCDLPDPKADPETYRTVIEASFAEEAILTGPWTLNNPGLIRISRLQFAGEHASLTMSGSMGGAPAELERPVFAGSAGLTLRPDSTSSICVGRSVFRKNSNGVQIDGAGRVHLIRSVLWDSPLRVAGSAKGNLAVIHCTGIGVAAWPEGSVNCLSLPTLAEAAQCLVDPESGRFDPKPGAPCVDAGDPLPGGILIPAFASMTVTGRPDRGAFEYYPPRELVCKVPDPEPDLITGEPTEPVPIAKRAQILAAAISGLRPNDTLKVGPGLWTEGGVTFADLRGEPYAPIRVIGDPPLGPAVHGAVNFRNCDRLTVEGFRFAGYQGIKAKECAIGLNWRDCGFTTVVGCEITEYGHCGVDGYEQGVTLLRNWIHHNGRDGRNHGIYWTENGPAWVIGNTFYGNSGWGYHNHQGAYNGWQAWKQIVHHNLFIGPGGAIVTTGSRGAYYNNTIVNPSHAAVWFYNAGHRDNRIINNICYQGRLSVHTNDGNIVSHNLLTSTNLWGGAHPIYGDPMFREPEKSDYRLKDGSPAIGAGINVGLDNQEHPTLGAYDGHEEWAPPKPIPQYMPPALQKVRKEVGEQAIPTSMEKP